MSVGRAFFWGQLSGAVEPLGGALGAWGVRAAAPLLPLAMAFAAGAMVRRQLHPHLFLPSLFRRHSFVIDCFLLTVLKAPTHKRKLTLSCPSMWLLDVRGGGPAGARGPRGEPHICDPRLHGGLLPYDGHGPRVVEPQVKHFGVERVVGVLCAAFSFRPVFFCFLVKESTVH